MVVTPQGCWESPWETSGESCLVWIITAVMPEVNVLLEKGSATLSIAKHPKKKHLRMSYTSGGYLPIAKFSKDVSSVICITSLSDTKKKETHGTFLRF